MCGIIGYTGQGEALERLIKGMKSLTYRGYDSNGVVVQNGVKTHWSKKAGKIESFLDQLDKPQFQGTSGMGHTRWATHGMPTDANAHPHFNCDRSIAVVHNGIVENYRSMKEDLIQKGHDFRSETDTEVLPHFISEQMSRGQSLREAIMTLVDRLEGSYAFAVLANGEKDKIIGVSNESPMIVGIGENQRFLASDIPALLEFTREIVVLEDEEIVEISPADHQLFSPAGEPISRNSRQIQWEADEARKQGYKHYMKKEIFEQPKALKETFGDRLKRKKETVELDLREETRDLFQRMDRIQIAACGTSYYAGLMAQYFLEQISDVPVSLRYASEFRYSPPPVDSSTLFIPISQSGETADTLAALSKAEEMGAYTLGVCNIAGSSMSRKADDILYTRAGLEVGVAATKTYLTQLALLLMLSLEILRVRSPQGERSGEKLSRISRALRDVPGQVEQILDLDDKIRDIASHYTEVYNYLFLGRKYNYPTALEGALKLKEISYIHAEGYAGGEMKHGPLALVDDSFPTVAIAPRDDVYKKMISNMKEIEARDGGLIGIIEEGDQEAKELCRHFIEVPPTENCISPIINTVPLQLLAYHMGDLLGCDVDQPRNLAKTVTVE